MTRCRSRCRRATCTSSGSRPGSPASSCRAASYGVLAAGRPLIVSADVSSETARLVEVAGCGLTVPPGRPSELAAAIRSAYDGELDLETMGRRAREYAEREATREIAVGRYRALLDRVIGR